LLAACEVRPLAPIAAPALTIMGRGTEVRLRNQTFTKLQRSDILDFATQRVVSETQISGHLGFELDTAKPDPALRVFGQDERGRHVKLKSLGATDYAKVSLDTIPTDSGMATSVDGVKVNDVLLFRVRDDHGGDEYGKVMLKKATSDVVTFDYTLQTDGKNAIQACPETPSPSGSGSLLDDFFKSPSPTSS
jgi:hypothetical protein